MENPNDVINYVANDVVNILPILTAVGFGAIIAALIGFLGGFMQGWLSRKHSFKMRKEEDKYEHIQYKKIKLYDALGELARNPLTRDMDDMKEFLNSMTKALIEMRKIYRPILWMLDDDDSKELEKLFLITNEHNNSRNAKDFLSSLVNLEDKVYTSINRELRKIKETKGG
ncbi:MAG: hypothetical protein FWC69_00960 [Defluviitaleaceae bacterium]|nr:hypothetical protein [Defluviitaleaceae bacterium]